MCAYLLAYSVHFFFFFNDTAPTEIYTLSLHDALPISHDRVRRRIRGVGGSEHGAGPRRRGQRSEEHTSELQSLTNLVCRLLLEKKKNKMTAVCYNSIVNESTKQTPHTPNHNRTVLCSV